MKYKQLNYTNPVVPVMEYLGASIGADASLLGVDDFKGQDGKPFVRIGMTASSSDGVIARRVNYSCYLYTPSSVTDSYGESFDKAEDLRKALMVLPRFVQTAKSCTVLSGPILGLSGYTGYLCQEIDFDIMYAPTSTTIIDI